MNPGMCSPLPPARVHAHVSIDRITLEAVRPYVREVVFVDTSRHALLRDITQHNSLLQFFVMHMICCMHDRGYGRFKWIMYAITPLTSAEPEARTVRDWSYRSQHAAQ